MERDLAALWCVVAVFGELGAIRADLDAWIGIVQNLAKGRADDIAGHVCIVAPHGAVLMISCVCLMIWKQCH